MKRLFFLALLILTIAQAARAQDGIVVTHPKTPNRDALDRLGLSLGWHTRIKLSGAPNGIRSLQLLPGPGRLHIAVQSHSGMVYLLDAATGDQLWSTQVGSPYWEGAPLAFNDRDLLITRRNLLYVLDRRDGKHRLYTVDRRSGRVDLGFTLPSVPSAPLAAADKFLYVSLGDRMLAYKMPVFEAAELFAKDEYGGLFKVSSVQPEREFAGRFVDAQFAYTPMMSLDQISFVTDRGLISVNRLNGEPRFDFKANGPVLAPPTQHNNVAYLGSVDATLYAVNMTSGRLAWRYLSPAPILRSPHATDNHVFVFSGRRGMGSLERDTGAELWRSGEATTFLSHSDRFAYVMDRVGKLMVLDIRKGTLLGQYDLEDWQVRVPNEYTDRIYLANHDGQIICLHPRGSILPAWTKTMDFEVKDVDPKAPEKKDPDKKDPDKKDPDKDPDKKDPDKKDPDKKDPDKEEKKDPKASLDPVPSILVALATRPPRIEAMSSTRSPSPARTRPAAGAPLRLARRCGRRLR